jgi:hypothetical protein
MGAFLWLLAERRSLRTTRPAIDGHRRPWAAIDARRTTQHNTPPYVRAQAAAVDNLTPQSH